jgi:hypothetical protein
VSFVVHVLFDVMIVLFDVMIGANRTTMLPDATAKAACSDPNPPPVHGFRFAEGGERRGAVIVPYFKAGPWSLLSLR